MAASSKEQDHITWKHPQHLDLILGSVKLSAPDNLQVRDVLSAL